MSAESRIRGPRTLCLELSLDPPGCRGFVEDQPAAVMPKGKALRAAYCVLACPRAGGATSMTTDTKASGQAGTRSAPDLSRTLHAARSTQRSSSSTQGFL